jgi:hypothetical protein
VAGRIGEEPSARSNSSFLDLKGPRVVPLGTIDGQHGDLPVQLVTDERRVVKGPTARP